ncbi:MAG: allantoinase AllB [Pseudomonadota bacterium]
MHFFIKSQNVLVSEKSERFGNLKPALIEIQDGQIAALLPYEHSVSGSLIDVGNKVVMPGIIDSHVHMNEPGRTEWEGIETATKAAAAGGITTLVDMPLNSIPPTTTVSALKLKRESAQKTAYVDYGFWGGVIPGNESELEPLVDAGVLGFKAFLIDSGVSEFPMSPPEVVEKSLPHLKKKGVPLLVHAELDLKNEAHSFSTREYRDYLASRPDEWEVEAIRLMISLAKKIKTSVHIVHLSSAKALNDIRNAKNEGLPITVETCPHYLTLESEAIQEGATHFKCAPPIREKKNQDALWEGLKSGIIDFIVSDHSPCTPQLKKFETGDFDAAWGGIAGLQFSLPVVWTELTKRGFGIPELSFWMSERPARFLNLERKPGRIEVGADADLVVWDPKASFTLEPSQIYHRHTVTPYLGKTFQGRIEKTFVRGLCVYDSNKFIGPLGQEVRRKT